jgi:hypothetical protein
MPEVVLAAQSPTLAIRLSTSFLSKVRLPDGKTLLFRRRPRSETEEPVFLSHFVIVEGAAQGADRHFSTKPIASGSWAAAAPPPLRSLKALGREGLTRTVGATLIPSWRSARRWS